MNSSSPQLANLRPLAAALALVALAALVAGCPTYEDTYSGTYREVVSESGRNSEAVELDFFRFGDNASAIVRFYKRDPITGDPFGEQQFCVWTDAQTFDAEKDKFRLYINKSSSQLPRSQLFGTVLDDEHIDVTLYRDQTGEPYDGIEDLPLQRYRDEPDTDCEVIDDFGAQIQFPRDPDTGEMQAMPPEVDYDIHNPVFAVSWLGVQPAQGSDVLAPVNRHVPAMPLSGGFDSNFEPNRHALKNDRWVWIPPPPDIVRMPSGTTTIALGHFVVVDDSEADRPAAGDTGDWQFSWDTDTEKVVATSLQRATRPSCESGTDHFGRALLFVEDSLADLSQEMQQREIANLLDVTHQLRCADGDRCNEHFYVVDVCADGQKVLNLELAGATQTAPLIPLLVTDEYLNSDTVPLPRINPYY